MEDDQSTGDEDISEDSERDDGEESEDTDDYSRTQSSRKRRANVLSRTELNAKKKVKSIPDVEQTNTTRESLCVGSIEYSNDTIHPYTMAFLGGKLFKLEELGASISKEWLLTSVLQNLQRTITAHGLQVNESISWCRNVQCELINLLFVCRK